MGSHVVFVLRKTFWLSFDPTGIGVVSADTFLPQVKFL
jgi:hypothetical protein